VAASSYFCIVNMAGPVTDGAEGPNPCIYFQLTDTANPPAFTTTWFYAADNAKNQMLAVALAAVNAGLTVYLWADTPTAGSNALTKVYRMWINAAGPIIPS
jgi:hypothetical protein